MVTLFDGSTQCLCLCAGAEGVPGSRSLDPFCGGKEGVGWAKVRSRHKDELSFSFFLFSVSFLFSSQFQFSNSNVIHI